MVAGAEAIVRAQVGVEIRVIFHGDDIDLVFAADVQFHQRMSDPCRQDRQLIDGILVRQRNKVKNVVGIIAHGELFRDVHLGIDDLVSADGAQQLRLNVLIGLGDDAARTVLFEQARHDQRRLEVLTDGDKADVKIIHAEGGDHGLVGAVADAGIGKTVAQGLDDGRVVVNDHHLVAQLVHSFGKVPTHAAHADDQNGFHIT